MAKFEGNGACALSYIS